MVNIVPFGKYKDRPIEDLLSDVSYVDWLKSQPWFEQKWENIYNIVFNQINTEHSETPEHNLIQSKFLNEDFVKDIILNKLNYKERIENHKKENNIDFEYKVKSFFEFENWDVYVRTNIYCDFLFEIKPIVGDDYPSILRQMQKNWKNMRSRGCYSRILYTQKIETKYVPAEQVIKMFENSEFWVVNDETFAF